MKERVLMIAKKLLFLLSVCAPVCLLGMSLEEKESVKEILKQRNSLEPEKNESVVCYGFDPKTQSSRCSVKTPYEILTMVSDTSAPDSYKICEIMTQGKENKTCMNQSGIKTMLKSVVLKYHVMLTEDPNYKIFNEELKDKQLWNKKKLKAQHILDKKTFKEFAQEAKLFPYKRQLWALVHRKEKDDDNKHIGQEWQELSLFPNDSFIDLVTLSNKVDLPLRGKKFVV